MSDYIAPDTTTKEWNSYPFSVDGVNFVSKIRKGSEFDLRLMLVPSEVFTQMNIDAIRSMIGSVSTMTRSEIISELSRCNLGGKNAILELA